MRRLLHLTFLCLLFSGAAMSQARYWVAPGASGNWNASANWSLTSGGAGGAGVPSGALDAIFDGGSSANCVLNSPAFISLRDFTINAGYTGTITQPLGSFLLVNRDFNIAGGTITPLGSVVITRNLTQSGGTFNSAASGSTISGVTSISAGTFNIDGQLQFDGNVFISNPGATINPGTSAVTFNGSTSTVININGTASGSVTFYDVILDKSNPGTQNFNVGTAVPDQIFVLNDLTLTNGSLGTGTGVVHVGRNLLVDNGFLGGLVDLVLDGSANSTVTVNAPFTTGGGGITTINKTNPAATVSFVTDLPSNTINFNTLTNNTFNVTSGTVNYPDGDAVNLSYGTFNVGAAGTFVATSNTTTFQGNLNIDGAFNANGGTVNLQAAAARTLAVQGAATNASVSFNNIILDNTSAAGNFNIQAGDVLIATGNVTITDGRFNGGTLQVDGNLTTSAASNATTAGTALVFGGSGNSIVTLDPAATGNWNGPITINKTGGGTVTLASPFVLDQNNQNITFTSGVVNTSATNYLHFNGNSITYSGASSASYVSGFVRRTGTTSFIYPTGDAGFFAPVNISGTTAFGGVMAFNPVTGLPPTYQVQYLRQNPQVPFPNTNNPPTDGNTPPTVLTLSQQEYFTVDFVSDVPGFPPTDYPTNPPYIWFSYENLRSGGLTDVSSVIPVAWLTNRWGNLGPSGNTTTNAGITYLRTGIRAFSIADVNPVFTFGTNDPIANALPVKWLSFTGRAVNGAVELNWSTASEKNNEKFSIERSADGTNFSAIGTVNGNGTTDLTSYYNFTDNQPLSTNGYYRIKQTDLNGKFSYSGVIRISGSGSAFAGLKLYPNPVTTSVPLNIENANWSNQKVKVTIINAIGSVVRQEEISFGHDSRARINVSGLQKGSYFMSTQVNGEKQVSRFVIQ
ncbi:T9SS type A sorting domain-containing protein [Flavihumibacter profundi]|uniref:T9SS type A sorting domain-containing protein n=1 Tax=Flavihumibacter profundi TaxID=2716883 RepID=UPI001CC37F99|nr:T9SS type A sorting domain-containing protein [Flavihumibacter profundi]MBZ5857925.1 T9SS type A sorting domain-containing protein [Flavihumibacter profundi]